jgi:transposase-like protein
VEASSDSEKEVVALRKRLREVEMERDILKKAALIFGRSG